MSTHNRIVLCDSRGDELFSGSSFFSETPAPPSSELEPEESTKRHPAALSADEAADEDEPVPPTLRSNVLASEPPVSRPIIVEDADLTAA